MSQIKARWAAILKRGTLALSLAVGTGAMTGCEFQSFFDPSQPHGFNRTPIVLPILSSLDVLDEYEPYAAGLSQVQVYDLIPEVREYVIGAADDMLITIPDLRMVGEHDQQRRIVDELGQIRLPAGIGTVQVAGRTASQVERDIARILEERNILVDAEVSVMMIQKRQNTFSIIGEPRQGQSRFGTYEIPKPDFRLLDAVAMAQGISGQTRTLYVFRTIPLTPEAAGERPSEPVEPGPGDVPEEAGRDPSQLIEDLEDALRDDRDSRLPQGPQAPVDRGDAPPAALERSLDEEGAGAWLFIGGEWVKVQQPGRTTGVDGAEHLITQRVIEVPYDRLLNGEMRYNIVIRPGDIIKVPPQIAGNVYISGNVNRPGTFILPGEKDLTIKLLLAAAGGFGPLAVPERGELIRRIGEDQEAIIRLDLRKIETGRQPDIFLKPNDQLRVGTNITAMPLAVIRNGFRMTYGFGFVLDRNFAGSVFGP